MPAQLVASPTALPNNRSAGAGAGGLTLSSRHPVSAGAPRPQYRLPSLRLRS